MFIDLLLKKAHDAIKNNRENIMLRTIDPIVRQSNAELLIKYFDSKKINHRNVDWNKSPDLLRLDIEKIIKKLSAEKGSEVLSDFYRINRVHKETKNFSIRNALFLFVHDYKKFEEDEQKLFHTDPYKELMLSLLDNGKVVGFLLGFFSIVLILAEALTTGFSLSHAALNALHFILGLLTVFFFNQPKEDSYAIRCKKTYS